MAIILCGVVLTAACASARVSVNSDYDPQALEGMAAYQNYSWMQHPQGGDNRVNNDLVATRVINAVDEVMAAKGYGKVQRGADFLVGWHASLVGKVAVTTVNRYYGYGYGRWRRGGVVVQDTRVREYDEGTLIIDVVDASSNELVWRGSAQGEVRATSAVEERNERIREVVSKILEGFPPPPGS